LREITGKEGEGGGEGTKKHRRYKPNRSDSLMITKEVRRYF